MIRFAALAILALAVVAVAQKEVSSDGFAEERDTQLALYVDDDTETEWVRRKPGMEIFADFCIQTRDLVQRDLKIKQKRTVVLNPWELSSGFHWFFNMTEEIIKDSFEATKEKNEQYSNGFALDNTYTMAFVNAFKNMLGATAKAFVDVATEKMTSVKEFANPQAAADFTNNGCQRVKQYERDMRELFDAYKQEFPDEAREKYAETLYDSVPCVTTRRISHVNGVCRFFMIGLNSYKRPDSNEQSA